jgi:hypothetical protein
MWVGRLYESGKGGKGIKGIRFRRVWSIKVRLAGWFYRVIGDFWLGGGGGFLAVVVFCISCIGVFFGILRVFYG